MCENKRSIRKIKPPNIILKRPLDLSVVIRCGRDEMGLKRTISSIDEKVEVVVSAAEDAPFIKNFKREGYNIAPHTYGNWSVAAQSGIDKATNNDVIMMDADSVFGNGAIKTIAKALRKGHLFVQPQVIYTNTGNFIGKLISNSRTYENQREPKAYSPGLGLKVQELTKKIGVQGNVYNLSVAYGDDGDLNQRRKEAKIDVYVARNALIYHDPITLEHELKTIYRFGVGKRQAQNGKEEPKLLNDIIKKEFVSDRAREYYSKLLNQFGLSTLMFAMFCRLTYVAGFIIEDKKY